MPRFINTYSKLRPVAKKVEIDQFSELQRCPIMKKSTKERVQLEAIAESEAVYQPEEIKLSQACHSRSKMNRMSKPATQKSRRNPTPLKIIGKELGGRYCPIPEGSPLEESSDENDNSIMYLSGSSEESTTLSDKEDTLTNGETCELEDSEDQYSDIEVPRDLPEPKRKSHSASGMILKLSQLSNKTHSRMKSKVKSTRKVEKPAHSTMLEGQFSTMNIDQFGISDISGNGPQFCNSESSTSYSLLENDPPSKNVKQKKSTSKMFSGGKVSRTIASSVYSLLGSESDKSVSSSPSKKKGYESNLKVTGKQVKLMKKSSSKTTQPHDSMNNISSVKGGKKQVSFQVKDSLDYEDSNISTPFNLQLPNRSKSYGILKKTTDGESTATACEKPNRATSTPQKASKNSKKAHGYHIMDLSFDVSAVSLPPDHDLVLTNKSVTQNEVVQGGKEERKDERKSGSKCDETKEALLDSEPTCQPSSEPLQEVIPVKNNMRKQNEETPSTQLKRQSPDAATPSKILPKKSRILKSSRKSGSVNRKRLNYQKLDESDAIPECEPIPDCVITTLPFPEYNAHPGASYVLPRPKPVNMRHIRQHPQGKGFMLLR